MVGERGRIFHASWCHYVEINYRGDEIGDGLYVLNGTDCNQQIGVKERRTKGGWKIRQRWNRFKNLGDLLGKGDNVTMDFKDI